MHEEDWILNRIEELRCKERKEKGLPEPITSGKEVLERLCRAYLKIDEKKEPGA